MFFGEFLVENKIITKGQLIEALVFQFKNMPSFLDVLVEEKILSEDEVYNLILFQVKEDLDLISAIAKKGLLPREKIEQIFEAQALKRVPLGEILIKQNILEHSVVEEQINTFLESKDSEDNEAPEGLSAAALESLKEIGEFDSSLLEKAPSTSDSSGSEFSAAALESLKEIGEFDSSLLEGQSSPDTSSNELSEAALESLKEIGGFDSSLLEKDHSNDELKSEGWPLKASLSLDICYLEGFILCFSDKIYKGLLDNLGKWKFDTAHRLYHDKFFHFFVLSKNASSLIKSEISYTIIVQLEKMISFVPNDGEEISKRFYMVLQDGLNLLWDFKNYINNTKEEKGLLEDSDWREAYIRFDKNMKKIEERMS